MLKKTFLLIIAIVVVGVSLPYFSAPPAAASTLEELQDERKELQERLIDINRELANIQDEYERAKQKAATYAERKYIVEQQIAVLKEIIELTTKALDEKQQELDEKKQQREETYELFKQRIRAMYMSNSSSNFSAMLGAETYTEYLMTSELVQRVSDHDANLIETLKAEEAEIEEAKAVIEEELEVLEVDKIELDAKYNELALLYQEAYEEMSAAEAQEKATEEERQEILDEYDRINREIDEQMGTGEGNQLGSGIYAWPVPGYSWISSYFGYRTLYGVVGWHNGVDIAGAGIYGARIQAADTGRVATVVYGSTGYGYYALVDHGANNWTLYAHMSSVAVSVGDYVYQGDTIGYVGSTGNSTGPHLHFEVRINGTAVNPLGYISYS